MMNRHFIDEFARARYGSETVTEKLINDAEALFTPRMNQHGPVTFHPYYYALLKMFAANRAGRTFVVETGTRYGLSSFAACSALDFGKDGDVLTCDIMYSNHLEAKAKIQTLLDVKLSGWEFFSGPSTEALPEFAESDPVWDVFLHDSDHSAKNMAWELDFAWERIPEGGLLICDDWDWPTKLEGKHTFQEFAARVGREFHLISTAAVIEK